MPSRILIGFIVIVVVMIAIPLLLAWTGSRRRPRVGRHGGVLVLRMPRGHHAILALIATMPFAAIGILALSASWAAGSGSDRWILGGLMLLTGTLAGGYLLTLEARGRIRIDDFSIEKVGAFTRKRSSWHDVAKLTYNPVNNWFFLTLAGGTKLYVVEGLDGIVDFAEVALQRLPPEVLVASPDAAEALRDLATAG
jgi:hypothetical protein